MELSVPATNLKELTKALACLSKFSDTVDLSCTPTSLKLSSVNSSRSAFAVLTFPPSFFNLYSPPQAPLSSSSFSRSQSQAPRRSSTPAPPAAHQASISLTTKALLSILRPRSSSSIETVHISLSSPSLPFPASDPRRHPTQDPTLTSRLIIILHCQHGITKTHKLTYTEGTTLYAIATKQQCHNRFTVEPKVVKEVLEHVPLGAVEIAFSVPASSASSDPTDEPTQTTTSTQTSSIRDLQITSYDQKLVSTTILFPLSDLLSYSFSPPPPDPSSSSSPNPKRTRKTTTITFSLKEFRAITSLAVETMSGGGGGGIGVYFEKGGKPLIVGFGSSGRRRGGGGRDDDDGADGGQGMWKGEFVIATTDFGGDDDEEDAEEEEKPKLGAAGRASSSSRPPVPLFRPDDDEGEGSAVPPTTTQQSQGGREFNEADEEEFFNDGGLGELGDDDWAEVERQATQTVMQVGASQAVGGGAGTREEMEVEPGEGNGVEEEEGEEEYASEEEGTQVGPTQRSLRGSGLSGHGSGKGRGDWNLFG